MKIKCLYSHGCFLRRYSLVELQQPAGMLALSSVQSLSRIQLLATPQTTVCQASLSITSSWSSPKPMSIKSVMPSNHLILCRPLLLLPSIMAASAQTSFTSSPEGLAPIPKFWIPGHWTWKLSGI